MSPLDLAFIDLETGGFSPERCAIVELACVLLDGATLAEYCAPLSVRVRPAEDKLVEPRAAAINGYSARAWRDAPALDEALWLLAEHLPGEGAYLIAGHNKGFDEGFLAAAQRETGRSLPRPCGGLDLMYLLRRHVPRLLPDAKLATCCALLGVVNHAPHRALGDARAAADCYRAARERGLIAPSEDPRADPWKGRGHELRPHATPLAPWETPPAVAAAAQGTLPMPPRRSGG